MALRYIDSMGDHYAAADANDKWSAASFHARGPGLHGYAMKGSFTKGLLFGSNTVIMEVYINLWSILAGGLFAIFDTSQLKQIYCSVASDGSLQVDRFTNLTTLIARTVPDLVRLNTWYHFGWRIFIHPTAGTIELRLNGGTVMNLTGISTTAFASSDPFYWSGALGSFGMGGNDNAIYFDDLVIMDDVADGISDPRLPGGGGFTKFIGPVEIKVKRPNGVGTLAQWVPTPTVPNWQNVDDSDPDADTTYNAADPTAVGASDLFAMENLALDEDVVAVQSLVLARKTEEGVAAIAKLNNDGTTTRVGPTVYQPSTYSYIHQAEPLAPDGTLWTKAKWDAIQYGYRRIV
jgi:hypothetical protein